MVLLRKSIPQKTNLQPAAELNVTESKKLKATASETSQKQKLHFFKNECFCVCRFGKFCFLSKFKNEFFLFYASESMNSIAIERMKVLFAPC